MAAHRSTGTSPLLMPLKKLEKSLGRGMSQERILVLKITGHLNRYFCKEKSQMTNEHRKMFNVIC